MISPHGLTQRQMFEKMMPNVYVFRKRGCSFEQITDLLNECGMKLQPSTVRTYYSKMLATRQAICQERWNEYLLLSAAKKQTSGLQLPDMTAAMNAMREKQLAAAESILDAIFGAPTKHAPTPSPSPTAQLKK